MEINATDVWHAITQPYGYWRASNPIVKFAPVLLMLAGSTIYSPALLLQGVLASEFMLSAPFNSRSPYCLVGICVAMGTTVAALLTPSIGIVPYSFLSLSMTFEIPRYVTVDGFFSLCIVIMMVSLFRVRLAFTSRDYAWLIDFIPGPKLNKFFGETLYAHVYGWLQLPRLVTEADIALKSRGVGRPSLFRFLRHPNTAIDELGLWTLYIVRRMQEMAILVEFFVMSRVRLDRRQTPLGRQLSVADVAVILVLICGILVPRLVSFVTSLG